MNIVSLTSTKGGVGKSTLAVNLAGALSLRGLTALTDEDETMQTAHSWIEAAPEQYSVQLLSSGRPPAAEVRYWVIDVEGRPALADMVQLSQRSAVLIPTGANGTELEPTVKLWNSLLTQVRYAQLQRLQGQELLGRGEQDRVSLLITGRQPVRLDLTLTATLWACAHAGKVSRVAVRPDLDLPLALALRALNKDDHAATSAP